MVDEQVKFTLRNGHVITIQPVGWMTALSYYKRLGWYGESDGQTLGEVLAEKTQQERGEVVKAFEGFMTYIAGWGVIDSPSDGDLSTLKHIDQYTGLANIDRANWVRFILMEGDDAEHLRLLTEVATLSRPDNIKRSVDGSDGAT